jgi:hypothetical protein
LREISTPNWVFFRHVSEEYVALLNVFLTETQMKNLLIQNLASSSKYKIKTGIVYK